MARPLGDLYLHLEVTINELDTLRAALFHWRSCERQPDDTSAKLIAETHGPMLDELECTKLAKYFAEVVHHHTQEG